MLHVTNGDVAGDTLKQCGFEGAVLPWRDVLHEGPVPEDLAPEALRAVRAAFLTQGGAAPFAQVLGDLRRRDAAVAQAERGVLWFEHDLYDQLQLLQVVDALGRAQHTGGWALVQADTYLGDWEVEDFQARLLRAGPLTGAQVALARRAWAAYRAPTPERWVALLSEDLSALPHLRAAVLRSVEDLPGLADGLARTERQLLRVLADGPTSFEGLFEAWSAQEEPAWMGDAPLEQRLQALAHGREPLVLVQDEVWALTAAGADVLDGRTDWVALGGPQRWLGGTWLDARGGEGVWRWDADARTLVGPL